MRAPSRRFNNLGTFDYFYVGQSTRLDHVDYPNGMTTEYSYANANGDHLLEQIRHLNDAGTPAVISQFDYTYRQDRNIDTWTVTQNGGPAKQWTFGYDDALQLANAVRTDTGTLAVLEQFRYGYDKAGNRTSVTSGSTNTNYPSNELNQTTAEQGFGETLFSGTLDEPALVTVNGQSATVISDGGNAPYSFEALVDLAEGSNTVTIEATDGNANVATQSYSVTAGGIQKTLEFDLNGNLRFEKDASGTVLREFQWDAKNRLLKIFDGIHETEFGYNASDQRVRIIERESGVEQSNEVYVWGGADILQKRDSNGSTPERNYFPQGFSAFSALSAVDHFYYTKDHLGSIREVVAADGTTIEAVYDYSPWGEVSKIAGTGVESDFLYTGHFYHEPSDLHLALYRAYNPALGMWLSRDPIAENGGINLYAYVGNNPINLIDPDGLMPHVPNVWSPSSDFGTSLGDFPDLHKAGRIIDKEARMADELINKHKKPNIFKRGWRGCVRYASSIKAGVQGGAGMLMGAFSPERTVTGAAQKLIDPEAHEGFYNVSGYLGRIKAATESSDPNEALEELNKTNAEKNKEMIECDK